MSDKLKHVNIRSKTAQEMLNGGGLERVSANYYSRYTPIEIDFDLDTYNLGQANDRMVQDYERTLRAHTIEMGFHASMLSSEVVNANSIALEKFTSFLEHDNLEILLTPYIGRVDHLRGVHEPFPLLLKQFITCHGNISIECRELALDAEHKLSKEYRTIVLEILHRRLHRLYKCLMGSSYCKVIRMPQRLLNFEPEDRGYSPLQEISLLRDKQAYVDTAIAFSEDYMWAEIESDLTAETLFAASHAIEESYPGISSPEVTQILLENVTELGEVARQGSHNKLYHSTIAVKEEERTTRGTFSTFKYVTTVKDKMVLDDQDKLHIPVIPRKGKCPLGFMYEGSAERLGRTDAFYSSVYDKYGVEVPRSSYIDPAVEHMAMAVIAAEPFINGRAHRMIEDFKNSLFTNAALNANWQKDSLRL